jgi:CubicO group peptidase (beta-lactamase class C family)
MAIAAVFAGWALTACHPKASTLPSNHPAERETHSGECSGARADATIAQVMSRMHVPGMALVVVRDGKVVKQGAYGVASEELGTPVTATTRFQIASATKVLTGTLLMQLVQEQVIALDAPVQRYLPDAPPAWESITIAQLAAHASGIPDSGILESPHSSTVEEVSASLAKQPLAFVPGTKAVYGLSDIVVLSRVIEKVTGKGYEELLRSRFGLQCTGFDHVRDDGPTRRADVIPGRVGVYRWEGDHQRTAEYSYPARGISRGGRSPWIRASCCRQRVSSSRRRNSSSLTGAPANSASCLLLARYAATARMGTRVGRRSRMSSGCRTTSSRSSCYRTRRRCTRTSRR